MKQYSTIKDNIDKVTELLKEHTRQLKDIPSKQWEAIEHYITSHSINESNKALYHWYVEYRLSTDIIYFLNKLWSHLGLPPLTELQEDIALFIINAPDRAGIEAFRGVGKSYITAGICLYFLRRNCDLKIMVVSANQDRADAFAIFTKDLIKTVPWLSRLIPDKGRRDSMVIFDVGGSKPDQSPSLKSVGIEGQLTGSRADIIIADDVEVPKNSMTQTARDKLWELVKEFDAVIKPLASSRILYLGTPQCEMSVYNELSSNRGYTFRIWPIQYPTEDEVLGYRGLLAPYIYEKANQDALDGLDSTGQSTEPDRFSMEDIDKRRLSYGKAGYALQFMLNTSLSDRERYPLRCKDIIVAPINTVKAPATITYSSDRSRVINDMPCVGLAGDMWYRPFYVDEVYLPYDHRVMSIDPSGRGKDETSYCIGLSLHGYIFVPEVGGCDSGYSDGTLEQLALIAKQYRVHEIVVESNFGDGMFTKLLTPFIRKYHPCAIEESRSHIQKEVRIIETLEPVLMSHKLIVDPKVIQSDLELSSHNHQLFFQLTRICKERGSLAHDDRLDALEIAVRRLSEGLSANAEELRDDYMEAKLYESMVSSVNAMRGVKEPYSNQGYLDLSYSQLGD